jgi:hypothetical protein
VNYEKTVIRKALDFPSLIELTVQFGVAVSAQVVGTLLANWLWQGKDRIEKIKLEETEIEFDDKEKIKKVVIKKIERAESD